MQNAMKPGCPMCRLILSSFRGQLSVSAQEARDGRLVFKVTKDAFASLVESGLNDERVPFAQVLAMASRFHVEILTAEGHASHGKIPDSEGHKYGFQLVEDPREDDYEFRYFGKGRVIGRQVEEQRLKQWHATCEKHHGQACVRTSGSTMPAGFRVIDVIQRCVMPFLAGTEYIALSYVWGKAGQLLNTADNRDRIDEPGGLSDHHDDIPLTIRDAMLLCEKIGFRYLWVDALCIWQDDEEDRNLQISSMDKVYSKASITIVAADGADCHAGLPGCRPGSRSFYVEPETIGGVTFAPIAQQLQLSIHTSTWNKRAWCLQEKVLSNRALIVTANQMFWKCRGGTFYEDAVLESTKGMPKLDDEQHQSFFDDAQRRNPFDRYREVATAFVQRDLSFQDDALDSVTGVLTNIQDEMKTSILCGIPEKYFEVCLLWQFSNLRRDIQELREAQFPSWSWIINSSTDGAGKFWDAALSKYEYFDSYYRLPFATHIPKKLCRLIHPYRYDSDGNPSPVESEVYHGHSDRLYLKYIKHEGPPTSSPMLRFRYFTSVLERQTMMAEFRQSPSRFGIPLHHALKAWAPRTIGFIADQAYFYVSKTPDPDDDKPQQRFAVAWDKAFKHVVGHAVIDKVWKNLDNDSLLLVLVARRLSEGPHLHMPRKMGWYYQCLVVERALNDDVAEAAGDHAMFFYRKLSVVYDVHCEDWQKAEPFSNPILLV